MSGMLALAWRNSLCYFRDRASVVFSLMGVLVVVLLYLLFLRNMLIDAYPDLPGMDGLIDAWVLSGILGIVSVTTSAGSLQTMIEDRANGRSRDILVTPMTPSQIAGGYILSTFIVGFVMSLVTMVLSLAYLVATGCPLDAVDVVVCITLLVPSALSGSIVIYAITSFMRSTGAFSGFFTIVSVLIGFLAGIYMPMGTMPGAMQVVGTLVPASHMAMLFRQNLCGGAMDDVFTGAPAETVDAFRSDMGFELSLGDFTFTPETSLLYVAAVTLLFFAIAVVGIRRRV
ncbi:MAG: ABC transporter permease [Candidatus Methanomethylophilaceae archaeon]|nr:ABC transporter permease [Candidatus Methanomethylophilaceae archaeon]